MMIFIQNVLSRVDTVPSSSWFVRGTKYRDPIPKCLNFSWMNKIELLCWVAKGDRIHLPPRHNDDDYIRPWVCLLLHTTSMCLLSYLLLLHTLFVTECSIIRVLISKGHDKFLILRKSQKKMMLVWMPRVLLSEYRVRDKIRRKLAGEGNCCLCNVSIFSKDNGMLVLAV